MKSYDVIVIGAGVVGSSVAFHLAALGARDVLVLDRAAIGAGTTAQSSASCAPITRCARTWNWRGVHGAPSTTSPPMWAMTTPPAAWSAAAT